MKPESGGVEAFFVGLSGTADATEVTDEFEGGERVLGPSKFESLNECFRRSIRNNMEEEIEARVTGGEKRW